MDNDSWAPTFDAHRASGTVPSGFRAEALGNPLATGLSVFGRMWSVFFCPGHDFLKTEPAIKNGTSLGRRAGGDLALSTCSVPVRHPLSLAN
jgi:hypothetical protein